MKRPIFMLIAMCAAASLFAQTPRKIVAPSIAIVMPAKAEKDSEIQQIFDKLTSEVQQKQAKYEPNLDTLDINYAVHQIYKMREQRAKPIMDAVKNKPFAGLFMASVAVAIQENMLNVEGSKTVLIDTVLTNDLESERQFARKNKVRYVLNPQKFMANKQGETPNISFGMLLYDSLSHKNSVIETLNSTDKHQYKFRLEGVRDRPCNFEDSFMLNVLCHTERVLAISTDTVLYKIFYDVPSVRRQLDMQPLRIAKMDSIFKAKPDGKVLELVMPFIKNEYKRQRTEYHIPDTDSTDLEHYTQKDCYNVLFNADKTKFMAFFITKRIRASFAEYDKQSNRGFAAKDGSVTASKVIKEVKQEQKPTNIKMDTLMCPRIYSGIFENGKWWIANDVNGMIINSVEVDLGKMQKQEFSNNTYGLLQDTSLAINSDFWYRNKFRTMQEKMAVLQKQIQQERNANALAAKRYNADFIQKEINVSSAELKATKGKEMKSIVKNRINFLKQQLKEQSKSPVYQPDLGWANRFQDEYDFYKNEYPEGYELVTMSKISAVRKEAKNVGEKIYDTAAVPFLQKIRQKRPDLYQENEHWAVNECNFNGLSFNQKYYFMTTTEGKKKRKTGYTHEHHYLLFDIENKKWYEWTYPKTHTLPEQKTICASEVFQQLAKWNDNYPTLNDPAFWANYVLKQADGKYLYLKPVFD